ncbi:MAG: hypothetical protein WAL71_13745 [Terriglobales bacterium]|jgi:hypothetical protein
MTDKRSVALHSIVMLLLLALASAQEFHGQLSTAEKQHILDGPFTVRSKTEDMPASVRQAFAKITSESSFSLANPGQKFQLTDVNPDRKLPLRRLVLAASQGGEWVIHYERGGLAHSYCVLIFSVDSRNSLKFIWGGAGFHPAESLEELRKMIASGQLADDIKPYW